MSRFSFSAPLGSERKHACLVGRGPSPQTELPYGPSSLAFRICRLSMIWPRDLASKRIFPAEGIVKSENQALPFAFNTQPLRAGRIKSAATPRNLSQWKPQDACSATDRRGGPI